MAVTLRARMRLAGKALVGLFHEQSATQAYSLLAGLYPGAGGAVSPRGARQLLEGYNSLPWLRAVSSRIAQSVAQTQWALYAPTDRKRNRTIQRAAGADRKSMVKALTQAGELEPLESHIMLDALANSNDYLVGPALMRTSQIHLDFVGETFWIKERNALGAPVGFWPIPPSWVMETPTPKRQTYRVAFSAWQGEIPDTEILWICDPNPANPYGRGSGIAQTLVDELETDEYAARHTRMTFLNRARPDLIIWPEAGKNDAGVISSDAAERLGERWRNEHQGFWKAALPFFATRKIGVHEVSQSFQDLQLTELRKFERDMIVQVYGMMPEEMGIVRDGALNRAALDSVDFIYKTNLIVPRIEFIMAHLQERLVPEYDERLVVDYVSPVQEDFERQLKAAVAAPHTLRVDEWRALQGQDPLPDGQGQVFIVPANLTSVPSLGATLPPVLAAGQPTVVRETETKAAGREPGEEAELLDMLAAFKEACDEGGVTAVRRELADDKGELPELSQRVGQHEAVARRYLLSSLTRLGDGVSAEALESAIRRNDADAAVAAVHLDEWARSVRAPLAAILQGAWMTGAQFGAQEARVRLVRGAEDVAETKAPQSIPWNVVNPESVAWASTNAAQLVRDLVGSAGEAVRASLQQIVQQGLVEGWGADKVGRLMRETIGLTTRQSLAAFRYAESLKDKKDAAKKAAKYAATLRKQRALLIARTELAAAATAGQDRLWKIAIERGQLLASRLERVWIATPGLQNLCEICQQLHGQVAPVDGPFPDGTDRPPRHPACRCAVGLRAKGGGEVKPGASTGTPFAPPKPPKPKVVRVKPQTLAVDGVPEGLLGPSKTATVPLAIQRLAQSLSQAKQHQALQQYARLIQQRMGSPKAKFLFWDKQIDAQTRAAAWREANGTIRVGSETTNWLLSFVQGGANATPKSYAYGYNALVHELNHSVSMARWEKISEIKLMAGQPHRYEIRSWWEEGLVEYRARATTRAWAPSGMEIPFHAYQPRVEQMEWLATRRGMDLQKLWQYGTAGRIKMIDESVARHMLDLLPRRGFSQLEAKKLVRGWLSKPGNLSGALREGYILKWDLMSTKRDDILSALGGEIEVL